ncbi:MAG TPA: hypothetical protein VHH88_06370 [Verrucomicrobiae bacterium]|nr:hypothetical protein [Verrucomicrobiae bacterium]
MVIHSGSARQSASLMIELTVAMVLITGALLPIAYSFASEKRLAIGMYQRAVATEMVDGEMEVLAAGEWRRFPPGQRVLPMRGSAATNLPPGKLVLMIQTNHLRLEWETAGKKHGGLIAREVNLR